MSNWEHASEAELAEGREAYSLGDPKHPDYGGAMELETIEHPDIVLFSGDPKERMRQMQETASVLAEPVRKRHTVTISGREHVRVEGWTMLGALLGVHPYTVWSRPIRVETLDAEGWEARVEARTRAGDVVGSAEAMCLDNEPNWKNRDEYALRSMAQTRATSKALRQPLGFVITLAGFDPTPAEEMVYETPSGSSYRPPDLAGRRRLMFLLRDKLVKAGKLDEPTFEAQVQDDYGKHPGQLNMEQTLQVIDRLNKAVEKHGL